MHVCLQIDAGGLGGKGMPQRVVGLVDQTCKRFGAVPLEVVGRIGVVRQRQDAEIYVGRDEQLEHFAGAVPAGFVAVEHKHHPHTLGVAPQELNVGRAQGRAHHGHGIVKTELMRGDAIGVAFDDDGRAGLANRIAGQVQPIEQAALAE